MMKKEIVIDLIKRAYTEDIGDGDHSGLACIPPEAMGSAKLLVKQEGIIAGIEIIKEVFSFFDPAFELNILIEDGSKVKPGDVAFYVKGKVQALLKAERLVLNIMQRMSGIATETNRYVVKLEGLKTKILDTRKTTPGFRYFEKEAVRIGGGVNHRMGLYDMIMLKDNHVDFCGGITKAIIKTNEYLKQTGRVLKIEIETRNINEVKEVLSIGMVNRIMLDNFSIEQTREAVSLINGAFETESSGGITFETLRNYAECGVDYISVGALTHQVKSLDLSLKAIDF